MTTKLKNLQMTKVALVPAGANPDAHIVLFKAKPVEKQDIVGEIEDASLPLTTAQRIVHAQLWAQWQPLWSAFRDSIWELMDCCEGGDPARYAPRMMQSIDEFQPMAREILGGLGLIAKSAPLFDALEAINKAGRVMSAQRMQQLKAAIAALQGILAEAGGTMQKGQTMPTLEDITRRAETAEAQVTTLTAERDALQSELAKSRQTPEEQEAAYLNSLPASIRKRYEVDQVEKAALREELRLEKDKREEQDYIVKVDLYRAVGLTREHWKVLKAIDAMPEAERVELLRLLKAASEQLKQSPLLRIVGADGAGAEGDSAWSRIETLANALVTKGGAATKEQAVVKVLESNPELRTQYYAEKRAV